MKKLLFPFFENVFNPFPEQETVLLKQKQKQKQKLKQKQKQKLWFFIRKINFVVPMVAPGPTVKAGTDVKGIYAAGVVIDSLNGSLHPFMAHVISQGTC